ncbi:hypothetical protein KY348_03275, partial [Candidatus Woesearchaeota archaeon]|nr:hypothetical protein [Candidatus Woesearchaeota archaeon]
IQSLRKKAGLKRTDKVKILIETDFKLDKEHFEELKEKVGASELEFAKKSEVKSEFESKTEIRGKEFRFLIVK